MVVYPDEVIKIDRKYIEEELRNIESSLLDKDGNLDSMTFDTIAYELLDNVTSYIQNCFAKVERDFARFERNMGAGDSNPHYKLYSRWDKDDFDLVQIFTNLSDAREMIREDRKNIFDQYEYKITEVKDGIEGTKNFYQPTLFK
ncbi:MAG: hypothetical protein NTZ36_03630 [Candidatus Jorgensenbacteria bacterium]|nr:hypothetical protein [Candidatus Jorgensenbacteria bacterium]